MPGWFNAHYSSTTRRRDHFGLPVYRLGIQPLQTEQENRESKQPGNGQRD